MEILKRATTPDDAAGHRVRSMFYADGDFMARFGVPLAVSCYGSTEAAGVSHLHQWRLGDEIPADASRYGGATRADIEDRLDDGGQILVRERVPGTLFAGYFADGKLDPTRDGDGWFATGDLGRRDAAPAEPDGSSAGGLRFLERAAESIRVKGEFVPIPFVEERLGAIPELVDLALWKKPGELVDDEVVLYTVADALPVEQIRAVARQQARGRVRVQVHHVERPIGQVHGGWGHSVVHDSTSCPCRSRRCTLPAAASRGMARTRAT